MTQYKTLVIAIAVLGFLAFSVTSYSFVAAQNVTAPTGNVTTPDNVTTLGNVTGANQTGGGNVTAPAGNVTGEIVTFYARGQVASFISEDVLGGRWKIDVTDGELKRVEVNMTMAKPDGSEFHTLLIDNFTAGGGANETAPANATEPAGNVTGGRNVTAPAGNETGGNVTTPGNETIAAQAVTLSQDGTFEISGTANIYMNDNPQWQNVPVTIESAGRVLTIDVDNEMTDNHFGGQPIYGFVTALIGRTDTGLESALPPIEAGAPAAPPAAPPAPAGNETEGNQTTPTPAANQTGGGGGTQVSVSITSGSSSKTTDAYDPNPVEISVGDTVTWTNDDSQPHTVTSGSNGQPDGTFDSSPNLNPLMAPGDTFEYTFEEAGEFSYYCAVHPNMVGTVNVS